MIQFVICWQQMRSTPPPGWTLDSRLMSHAELGGVSDWKGHIYLYRRSECQTGEEFWTPSAFKSVDGAFNHTVVDPMAFGHTCGPPDKRDYDSGKELFPLSTWDQAWSKRLKLPSQLSPTKYVRRAMTADECLRIFDVPESLTSSWTLTDKRAFLACVDTPIKIVVPLGQCVGAMLRQIRHLVGQKDKGTGTGGGGEI